MWGPIALTMSATKAIIIHKERNENEFGCKKTHSHMQTSFTPLDSILFLEI